VRTRDLAGDLGTMQFSERVAAELGSRVKSLADCAATEGKSGTTAQI
jgi:hypothetical protein